ncbi:MAG TPA: hypothetical protein VF571_20590 [Pyrinomonadaceae bacterium]|jgi:hypothetical protein
MSILERLTRFVAEVFKTNLEIFLEALKLSPNAQGYVSGSITELLLKKKLQEDYGFEVKRIREKWEGRKHPNHHGDFYFRKPTNSLWYVLESKGVKSNSEKWNKLYNYDQLKSFLILHADKIDWIDKEENVEPQVVSWLSENLPKFQDEYNETIYNFEDVKKYKHPKKENAKSKAILSLQDVAREKIGEMISERLNYLESKLKVLETHFVAGKSKSNEREQATPRINEFNIISVDIFLKYNEHQFFFANPKRLESSRKYPKHLRQNYIIGFVFFDADDRGTLNLSKDWCNDLNEIYETLNPDDAVLESEMREDTRNFIPIDQADDIDT